MNNPSTCEIARSLSSIIEKSIRELADEIAKEEIAKCLERIRMRVEREATSQAAHCARKINVTFHQGGQRDPFRVAEVTMTLSIPTDPNRP